MDRPPHSASGDSPPRSKRCTSKTLLPITLQLCGAADCGLQIDRSIAVIVRGVDDVLALAARLLESPSRAINCTTTRGASHAGGEPRVVASRRDRRAPPMGGVRRERRGGGHRRGWRDDWSCRGRAGRRLGGGVRASRRCCCSSRILSYIFRGAILSESVGALPFRFFMGRTFGAPRRLQISYVGISTYGKDHGKDMGAPSCTKKLPKLVIFSCSRVGAPGEKRGERERRERREEREKKRRRQPRSS